MSAALISRLIAAGTPADLVAEVAMEFGRAAGEREALAKRRASDAARKQDERKRKRSRDVTGQGVTGRDIRDAPPSDKETSPRPPKEINSPSPTDDANAPSVPPPGVTPGGSKPKRRQGQRKPGSRLPANWEAPSVESLPLEVQAIVHQWPAGGYEITAIMFRNHWLSEGRAIGAKRDWPRTWHNWLIRENSAMLRAKRQGVDFIAAAKRLQAPPTKIDADWLRKTASFFRRIGRDDEADEYERRAEATDTS